MRLANDEMIATNYIADLYSFVVQGFNLSRKRKEAIDDIYVLYPMINVMTINFSVYRAFRTRILSLYYLYQTEWKRKSDKAINVFPNEWSVYYHYIILQFMKRLSPGY